MGTNYYLHLGKRSAAGEGQCSFTWAVSPAALTPSARPRLSLAAVAVQDEYGREMTLAEFLDLIGDDMPELAHIGQRFS